MLCAAGPPFRYMMPSVDPEPMLTDVPELPERPPDRYSRRQRVAAGVLLVVFAAAAIVTTALSLGSYCLTTDGADTRSLLETLRALFQ